MSSYDQDHICACRGTGVELRCLLNARFDLSMPLVEGAQRLNTVGLNPPYMARTGDLSTPMGGLVLVVYRSSRSFEGTRTGFNPS